MKAFMQDAKLIKADTLFDKEQDLDLGGVHVKLLWFGAAHTKGDEITYVAEDRLILPGDVVENRISPNIICDVCSPRKWAGGGGGDRQAQGRAGRARPRRARRRKPGRPGARLPAGARRAGPAAQDAGRRP
ncbi:MAG: hypothetical protein WDN45_05485 [Caulobacteraceae bacterium]